MVVLGYGSIHSSQNFLRTQYFRLVDPWIMAPMSQPMDQQITAEGPTIAIFNVAMIGHVNPTFALVQELCKRGCKVSYFLPPVAPIRAAAIESGAVVDEGRLERAGAIRKPYGKAIQDKFGVDLRCNLLTRRQFYTKTNFVTTCEDLIAELPASGEQKWADELRTEFSFSAVGCLVSSSAPHVITARSDSFIP
ncbi:yjiC, partial [Symbiodinium necroappetens]